MPSDPKRLDSLTGVEAEIHRVCGILGSIAEGFGEDSVERRALEGAAIAFQTVQRHKVMKRAHEQLKMAFGGELTAEMRAQLERKGINSEDFEDEVQDETSSPNS